MIEHRAAGPRYWYGFGPARGPFFRRLVTGIASLAAHARLNRAARVSWRWLALIGLGVTAIAWSAPPAGEAYAIAAADLREPII